ncbi:MAG: D-sedoheptulose 7-phosphate isomerase [Bacilli bacterium]|jgi:D-sedoheptulose 7-phosphate isomerase
MEGIIKGILTEQENNLKNLQETKYISAVSDAVKSQIEALKNGKQILIAGNGGSAADSQHFAAELVGRFMLERKGIPAIALTTDSSIMTSIGNDYDFNVIFSRQIEALGHDGDVFVGISTSGNSENIIRAVNEAKKKGIKTIGLLGCNGGKLAEICDICIIIPYNNTARIQEHHIMTIHIMCQLIEQAMVI